MAELGHEEVGLDIGARKVELLARGVAPNIIDGRNVLDPRQWAHAGWNYLGMGRGVSTW